MYRSFLLVRDRTSGLIRAAFKDTTAAQLFSSRGFSCFGWYFLNFLLRRAAKQAKFGTNHLNKLHWQRNEQSSSCVEGCSNVCHRVGRMLRESKAVRTDNKTHVVVCLSEELESLWLEFDSCFVY